jgi:phytoene synthase
MFGEAPLDDKALKTSLRETEGAVFELAAAILGDRSESARAAAAHAGVAYGLTGTLLKLPFLASRQKAVLPSSYMENRGIDLGAIHRGETSESFGAAVADLRGVASRALQQFRAMAGDLDRSAWPSFLPLTLVKPYLRAMATPDFDPLHTVVAISPLRRFWRIWRAARRHTL